MVLALNAPNKKIIIMLQIYFDRFAIVLSGICAIHCIALPIVASLMPLLATTIQHGYDLHEFWFHQFILVFILPISLFALVAGYRCHKEFTPIVIGGIGIGILVFTALFAEALISNHIILHSGETILTIIGGIVHAIGHVLNVIATRSFHIQCSMK